MEELLKDILVELKKINEYIDIKKTAQEVTVQEQLENKCYISVDKLSEGLVSAVKSSIKTS